MCIGIEKTAKQSTIETKEQHEGYRELGKQLLEEKKPIRPPIPKMPASAIRQVTPHRFKRKLRSDTRSSGQEEGPSGESRKNEKIRATANITETKKEQMKQTKGKYKEPKHNRCATTNQNTQAQMQVDTETHTGTGERTEGQEELVNARDVAMEECIIDTQWPKEEEIKWINCAITHRKAYLICPQCGRKGTLMRNGTTKICGKALKSSA